MPELTIGDRQAARRPPVRPSLRTLSRMVKRHAELLRSMSLHVLLSQKGTQGQLSTLPTPVLFVPLKKVPAADFERNAGSLANRAWGGYVVLQWPDGTLATLQIAYRKASQTAPSPHWIPLTLASGRLASELFKRTQESPSHRLVIVAIASLRLQSLVSFASGADEEMALPTVTMIQPGITRLSHRRSISVAAAGREIIKEVERLSAGTGPAAQPDPKTQGKTRAKRW